MNEPTAMAPYTMRSRWLPHQRESTRWTSATADRRAIVDVPFPQIVKANVEVFEKVLQKWIYEQICEQIVAVPEPRFRSVFSL